MAKHKSAPIPGKVILAIGLLITAFSIILTLRSSSARFSLFLVVGIGMILYGLWRVIQVEKQHEKHNHRSQHYMPPGQQQHPGHQGAPQHPAHQGHPHHPSHPQQTVHPHHHPSHVLPSALFCTRCGNKIAPHDIYCSRCGMKKG
ncbi:MAG: hypothetical protein ABIC95_04410 [archaeon]